MTPFLRASRSVLIMSAFALVLGPLHLRADSIPVAFQFTGICVDCPETGIGTGILTLQNYTLGTSIDTLQNFVSFTYSSDVLLFSVPSTDQVTITGMLPDSLPGPAYVNIQDTTTSMTFFSTTGFWCTGVNCNSDTGTVSTWDFVQPVPEPATVIPAGLGALCLLLAGRRARPRKS